VRRQPELRSQAGGERPQADGLHASRRRPEQELPAGSRGLLLRLPHTLSRVRAPVPRLVPARRNLGRGDDPAAPHADAAPAVKATRGASASAADADADVKVSASESDTEALGESLAATL